MMPVVDWILLGAASVFAWRMTDPALKFWLGVGAVMFGVGVLW
jgi:hypothetical protein